MATHQTTPAKIQLSIPLVIATLLSGICWFIANGLNGDYWWLLWLAPVPVLLIAFSSNSRTAWWVAFIAYAIGRMSWFSYLVRVATLLPAILFTLILAAVFALIIWLSRKLLVKTNAWYSLFGYPVFFTLFEWLVLRFSADGSAASIAYSQSDFLPLVQVISVTGLLGITFFVSLVPSTIAMAWHFRNQRKSSGLVMTTGILAFTAVIGFGTWRLNHPPSTGNKITAGLVSLQEKEHDMRNHPDFEKGRQVAYDYAREIASLSQKGAKIIVLPERALNLNADFDTAITNILANVALKNQVYIVAGCTDFRNPAERNAAIIIGSNGVIVASYNKCHLVTGLENQFVPGNEITLFNLNGQTTGLAICKDLDFPGFIDKYGKKQVALMAVPAWDFTVDDWLHSRMAVLRGVENGFSEIRTARLGRLTITDAYGRVIAETSSAAGNKATLIGTVEAIHIPTAHTRFGDWFGIINGMIAIVFILLIVLKKDRLKIAVDNMKP